MPTPLRTLRSSLALTALLLIVGPAAAEPPPEKDWEIRITPYLEFTNIDGKIRAENFQIDIGAGFGDIFQRLNLAFFGEVGARWRRLVASVDVIWANLGDKSNFGPITADWELDMLTVDTKFGYRVLSRHVGPGPAEVGSQRGRLHLDLMAGVRVWRVNTEIDVTPLLGNFDVLQSWVEPSVGFRLGWRPFERWHFGLRGDAGGFDAGKAEITWRADGLIAFALGERWDLVTGYRARGISEKSGDRNDRASLDYVMHGPLLGVSFHF